MNEILLFTDGSVNVQSNKGVGAYLIVENKNESLDLLKKKIQIKSFQNTSSVKLELQTLLWALKELDISGKLKVIIFTDSQNTQSLLERRKKLVHNNFLSKKNIPLKNADLYKEFYAIADNLNMEIIKIRGHQPGKNKNRIEQIFTLVDRASRKALRRDKI